MQKGVKGMPNTIRVMNGFILVCAGLVLYGGIQYDETLMDAIWPIATVAAILLARRSNQGFWKNIAYLGSVFYLVGMFKGPLHLDELSFAYFSNSYYPVIVLVLILTIILAYLHLSTDLLTIGWTVYFLLNLFTTYHLPTESEGGLFVGYFNSSLVVNHMITNYSGILLLTLFVGLFFETLRRNRV